MSILYCTTEYSGTDPMNINELDSSTEWWISLREQGERFNENCMGPTACTVTGIDTFDY